MNAHVIPALADRLLFVDPPDDGAPFADMEVPHGGDLATAALTQPRIEADVLLSGALAPVATAASGEIDEARISGVGAVGVRFR